MRSSQLVSLVLCASLLPTLSAVAAAKAPSAAQKGLGSGHRPRPPVNRHGGDTTVLRRDRNPSSAVAFRRSAQSTSPKGETKEETGAPRAAGEAAKASPPATDSPVQTHRVKRGETLGRIAACYDTLEAVLMNLNGLTSDDSIREGQILFVPSRDKSPPAHTASSSASFRRYAKAPKEKGYVELSTHATRFVGLVVDKEGRLRPAAVRALNDALGAGGKHPPLPERLIRLLVKVSDAFGGRPIHAVSGYRTNSYYQDSRHRLSAAIDFAIADVPNTVVCEYLRELDDVGVGYYPNSTFVHLDVRKQSAYWVDYAGPGEPPRSSPNAPRPAHGSKRWLLAEIDALVEHTKKAMERADTESPRDLPVPTLPKPEPPLVDRERPRADEEAIASSRGSSEPVSL